MIISILIVDILYAHHKQKKEARMERKALYTPTFQIIHAAVTTVEKILAWSEFVITALTTFWWQYRCDSLRDHDGFRNCIRYAYCISSPKQK